VCEAVVSLRIVLPLTFPPIDDLTFERLLNGAYAFIAFVGLAPWQCFSPAEIETRHRRTGLPQSDRQWLRYPSPEVNAVVGLRKRRLFRKVKVHIPAGRPSV